jgi:hypothetical protein
MAKKRRTQSKTKTPNEATHPVLTIQGYKSFHEQVRAELRPLTILAGANSSGKSSLIQPLLLMKQTLEAPFDPGPLLISGPNVQFSKASEMFWNGPKGLKPGPFTVGLDLPTSPNVALSFSLGLKGVKLASMSFMADRERKTIKPGMNSQQIAETLPEEIRLFAKELYEDREVKYQVGRNRCFLGAIVGPISPKDEREHIFDYPLPFSPVGDLIDFVRGFVHLPGLRHMPQRAYPRASTAMPRAFPGVFHDYFASVIDDWEKNDRDKRDDLDHLLDNLGLGYCVRTRSQDDIHIEVLVSRLQSKRPKTRRDSDMVNIADVGLGVLQALPVLVALLSAEQDQPVFLEQPEIHLHPRAQLAMAGVLAQAVKRGVRVIVETHSPLLLLGVQTIVAKGQHELDKDAVKLHWFFRDDEGVTRIDSRDLDENGTYGDWPEDFGDTTLQAQHDFLTSSMKQ